MNKKFLLLSVLLSVCISVCFVMPANGQFLNKVFGNRGKDSNRGDGIKLETTSHPNTQFSKQPEFALRFEDKRISTDILSKWDGSGDKPEVRTEVEPFEFVRTELGKYMAQLGFSCSESSSSEISLFVTLDKFDVGYYSGKGWAARPSMSRRYPSIRSWHCLIFRGKVFRT